MRSDWPLILLLYAAGLLAAAHFAKLAVALDAFARVYPGQPLALAVSAISVAGILFGVTAGMIAARFGARRVLLAALVFAGFLSVAGATLPPFDIFMLLRLGEGAAHLAIVVSAPTLMAALARPEDKPVVMGLWGTFFGLGFAVAAVVVPLLPGPGSVLWAHGLALWAIALPLAWRLPKGAARPDPMPGGLVARHVAIYTSRRLLAPAVGFFWHTLMFLGLLTFLPPLLGPWLAAVLPVIALGGTFAAGILARRFGARQVLIGGFLATLPLLLAAALWPSPLIVLPLFAAIGLVPGAAFSDVPALNPVSGDQARANGAVAQLGNLGTAATTPLFAAVGGGAGALFSLAAAISATGLVVTWLIHRNLDERP